MRVPINIIAGVLIGLAFRNVAYVVSGCAFWGLLSCICENVRNPIGETSYLLQIVAHRKRLKSEAKPLDWHSRFPRLSFFQARFFGVLLATEVAALLAYTASAILTVPLLSR